jgi:sec-independent protein translocase protein TatC
VVAEPLDDSRMSLVEHLTELRSRVIKCVIAVVIGLLLAFFLYPWIFDFLIAPYEDIANEENSLTGGQLLQTDPLEGFAIRMQLSVYCGIAFAMPVLLWQLWRFVTPGLYAHERRYAIPFVASALVLFVLGAGLAYYTLPQALNFLVDIGGDDLVTAFAIGKYVRLVTYMMLAFGIGFEFPIVLVFLQIVGVVEPSTLASFRRYAIVAICILVAIITPSGDPISMLMLSLPMILFYEISILIGRLVARRRARAT